MAAKAEAVAIIIDVNPLMSEAPEGEETPLQKCIAATNMIIQRKIFNDTKKNKDEAALILFGTDGTSNGLNDQAGEGYDHITLAKEMDVMDLPMLQFINNQIVPGHSHGDFIDALVVALDHLHTKCMGRKMEQKIILFSNMASEFAPDQLDAIINGIKANDVNLIFVGPEVNDEGHEDENVGDGTANEDGANHRRNNNQDGNMKELSSQQKQGINCIRHVLDQVDGEGMSISEVLPLLSFFEKRRRKLVTTFRGPIEIGSDLKINTYAYVKTSQERPASWKKLSALAEQAANRDTMKVETERTFYRNDENQTEVDKDNTTQAYRYGKTLVPMTSDDQKTLKLQTTKGCLVLGFTSRDNIERHMFSRIGCHIFVPQPGDEHAAVAFSALCHALEEKNMVAIVRYVARGNTDPKIGFLAPHIKSSYESLIFVALPFREDIRQYGFASLQGGKNKEPSEEQLQAVDSLIDSMGLVQHVVEDGEEVEEELFKPKNILNPIIQRQCQCIQSRALDAEESQLPVIEEYIQRSITVLPEMAANCQATVDKLKEIFPLEEVGKKKTTASNMFGTSDKESDAKKAKTEDETDGNFDFASLSRNQITEVGTVNPIQDFEVLIENADRERFLEVCSQMRNRIMRLVLDSFLDQYYAKALECLKALKQHCIKMKVATIFNELLIELKEATLGKRRQEFWDLVVKDDIKPIHTQDAAESKYSKEEADEFFANKKDEASVVEEQPAVEDADDLLDMM